MALHTPLVTVLLTSLILPFLITRSYSVETNVSASQVPESAILEFAINFEYLEGEFFLFGALGHGFDVIDPGLAKGGPPPIGGQMARLDPLIKDVITQHGYQEIGNLRAVSSLVNAIPRPLLNLSREVFADIMNQANGRPLNPPFDPYANSINYLLAAYVIPYVGLNGLVGVIPTLQNVTIKTLAAGLLGVEAGQDAVIRTLLYQRRKSLVYPYGVTVAEFTNRISNLRNKLGNEGIKDEGLVVPPSEGAEGKVSGNVLAADKNSVSYPRNVREILRIFYLTGDERMPGGFFPKGANGQIAKSYIGAT